MTIPGRDTLAVDRFHVQFRGKSAVDIILLSKCKLAYQASIPYSELKRILALK